MREDPSIHFLFPLNPIQSCGCSLSLCCYWARDGVRVHPERVVSPSQGHRKGLRVNLESPINLTHLFLDGGRKPEYLEGTHACTSRYMQPLHRKAPARDFNLLAVSRQQPIRPLCSALIDHFSNFRCLTTHQLDD